MSGELTTKQYTRLGEQVFNHSQRSLNKSQKNSKTKLTDPGNLDLRGEHAYLAKQGLRFKSLSAGEERRNLADHLATRILNKVTTRLAIDSILKDNLIDLAFEIRDILAEPKTSSGEALTNKMNSLLEQSIEVLETELSTEKRDSKQKTGESRQSGKHATDPGKLQKQMHCAPVIETKKKDSGANAA